MRYIATFYTHLAALKTQRALSRAGLSARLMPVPRKLSASCGTCVSFEADDVNAQLLDADGEAVYLVTGEDAYVPVQRAGESK